LPAIDHTKLFVIDKMAAFVGSATRDPRSLRLNFEFNLECYDAKLAQDLTAIAEDKMAHGHKLTQEEIDSRSLVIKLRDGLARLCSPFL
jgi:cardiolipin synthase